jgi:iron(III) transport system ATP-binding protein
LSNLDAKLRLEMRGEIRRICKESGLTVLYVTHDQKEALSVADRLAVLEGGCVRQVGSPAEVYRRPQTRFVADFIGETNVLKGTVSAPVGGEVLAVATSLGELVGYRCSEEFQPKVGASVLVSVRPESWQLRVEPGDENSVRGRIHNTIYLGEMAQYDFGTDGAVLSIYEMNPRFTEGTRMREFHAVARREDVVVLPVEGTG